MSRKLISLVAILAFVISISSVPFTGMAAAKQKVTFWYFATNNGDEWKARKTEIENKFNIELDIVEVPQNAFVQKLQAALMSGDGPDMAEWLVEGSNATLNANPDKSLFIPLEKYIAKSAVMKKVMPSRLAWQKYGTHTYGLPHDVHPVVMIYNDTLWKSVKVDIAKIQTWDEFFVAAQKLSAAKQDGKPLHYALPENGGLNGTMWMIWQQTGAQILDKTGKPQIDNPAFTAYVKKWLSWYKTDTMVSWDWGNFSALLKNGTLASYITPDWWVSQVDDAAKEGKYQFKVRALPYYSKGGPQTASWGGTFLGITKKGAPKADLLYKVIEYAQYDKVSVKTRYQTTGMIPPLSSVFTNEMFQQPDPRFGGFKLGVLQTTMAKKLPLMNCGDVFWDAVLTDFNGQYTEMASDKITVEEGIKKAQAATMKRFQDLSK